ncbi:NtaA/DmoA family FMN-dependent monooxygenase [Pseudonocardia yunnanensis]|uniref:NtaA/DmoA family FMN-dependent monooxygenase n=1 Tax=Pseudonocardia yunnanensis TaxID=58107 RepID=A0ABW4F135_9PSEU
MGRRQLILGAHFPGKEQVAWRHPANMSLIDVDTFLANARAAERGNMHFLFLADALTLAEKDGTVLAHTLNGRPDTLNILVTLAGATTDIGFLTTLNVTYNEPYDLARQIATFDHLSGGRVAFNLVTAAESTTHPNFRRGDFLDHSQRYVRAREFLAVSQELWHSWSGGPAPDLVEAHTTQFDLRATPALPESPQGHPVIVQAGASSEGAEFAARFAEVKYIIPRSIEQARADYADVKGRLAKYGRNRDDFKLIVGQRFVVADTDAEAHEKFDHLLDLEFTDQAVIEELQRLWLRDLSGVDPDGPLPTIEPDYAALGAYLRRSPSAQKDPHAYIAERRTMAEEAGWSIREFVRRATVRPAIVGSPTTVADTVEHWMDTDAADGFISAPQVVPMSNVEFIDRVIPLLQEKGIFRTESPRQTLRESLGLPPGGVRLPAAAAHG